MIVETLTLDYTPDALTRRFAPIAHLPWAMLLSSAQASHSDNRFDILTANPRATLVTRGAITSISDRSGTRESAADPLLLVQQQCDALGVTPAASETLPFQGGALGLFGYDLGRRFETLPARAEADLITPDMAVGIYDWALIADHHQQTLTLVALEAAQARLAWLTQWPAREALPFSLTSGWRSNLSYADYAARFAEIGRAHV